MRGLVLLLVANLASADVAVTPVAELMVCARLAGRSADTSEVSQYEVYAVVRGQLAETKIQVLQKPGFAIGDLHILTLTQLSPTVYHADNTITDDRCPIIPDDDDEGCPDVTITTALVDRLAAELLRRTPQMRVFIRGDGANHLRNELVRRGVDARRLHIVVTTGPVWIQKR